MISAIVFSGIILGFVSPIASLAIVLWGEA